MIECPWCNSQVILENNNCPVCRHEVLDEHLNSSVSEQDHNMNDEEPELADLDPEARIANSFSCTKCQHDECDINELAMTGAGLSKLLNIQYQHYLFVSCVQCGFVEIYDPSYI